MAVKIKYGFERVVETKEEAIERVLSKWEKYAYYFEPDEYHIPRLKVEDGKLLYAENKYAKNPYKAFKEYFKNSSFNNNVTATGILFISDYTEAEDVIEEVEEILVKRILDDKIFKDSMPKPEPVVTEEEVKEKDALIKENYEKWKEESARLGIPFDDFCSMKASGIWKD